MEDVSIIVPVGFFLLIASIAISGIYFSFRKKAILVEKGYSADEIVKILNQRKKTSIDYLKFGIILFGIGLGFLIGSILEANTKQDFWFPSCITIGIAMGLFFASKVKQKSEV
ncbi:MAG: hypothetical protein O3A55_00470 [Bacteroidetes bacterium]|nr:hypothetical protein [Bacteroidota bacterium]